MAANVANQQQKPNLQTIGTINTRPQNLIPSGSNQRISSVHSSNVEKRDVENISSSSSSINNNNLKAIAKIHNSNGNNKLIGEIIFEQNQVIFNY